LIKGACLNALYCIARLRESEFCAVATVQTQFLAGAVNHSHQHCMYTVATSYKV